MKTPWRRSFLSRAAVALAAISAGIGLRLYTRPSLPALVESGQRAFAMGDYDQAETIARSALGRSTRFAPARNLMLAITQARSDHHLRLAVLHDVPTDDPQYVSSRLAEAELALQLGLAARAFSAWSDVRAIEPANLRPLDGLVLLASVRLDREQLRGLLLDRLAIAAPRLQDVRLLLSLESLQWDSPAVADQVGKWLTADPHDIDSRVSLARYALRQGNADRAIQLLRSAPKPLGEQSKVLLADAYLANNNVPQAQAILDGMPELTTSGEYWSVVGQLAMAKDDLPKATTALARAAALRPLNREIRARYAECLRRGDDRPENKRQSTNLDRLREIGVVAQAQDTAWNARTVTRLAKLCEAADANAEAMQLYRYLLELDSSHPTAKASVERCQQKLSSPGGS